jgi:hypothetical protein
MKPLKHCLASGLERDERPRQPIYGVVEKCSHARGFALLDSYQAAMPADVIRIPKQADSPFVGDGIVLQARYSFF